MVMLLVYLIMAISLLGSVGYSVFTFQRTSEMVALAGRNSAHMEAMVSLTRAALRYDQGTKSYMAPLGTPDDNPNAATPNRMRLPTWVVGDDHTPWGGRYGWCPLSTFSVAQAQAAVPTDVAGVVVGGPNARQYAIAVQGITDDRGRSHDFVSGMDWAAAPALPRDVVGVVVSPTPLSVATPDCGDVVYRDGYYLIDPSKGGGIPGTAFAVTTTGLVLTTTLSQVADPYIYAAPGATGKGDGSTAADAMALDGERGALSYWRRYAPKGLTIELAAGSYALDATGTLDGQPATDLSLANSGVPAPALVPDRAYLNVVGPSSGTALIAGATDADGKVVGDLLLGVNVQMAGISIDPGLTVHVASRTQATLSVGSAGAISVEGGDLGLAGGAVGTLAVRSGTVTADLATLGALTQSGGTGNVTAATIQSIAVSGGTASAMASTSVGSLAATGGTTSVTTASIQSANLAGGATTVSSSGTLGTLATTGGTNGVTAASIQSASLGNGSTNVATTGAIGSVDVAGGANMASASSVSSASVRSGDLLLSLDGPVTGASLAIRGGSMRIAPRSSATLTMSGTQSFTGGRLTLDAVNLTATQVPGVAAPGTGLTLLDGAAVTAGTGASGAPVTYTTAGALWEALPGVTTEVSYAASTKSSCPIDGTPCTAICPVADTPYLVGGRCSPANARTTLIGFGQGTGVSNAGWSCQFVSASPPPDPSMSANDSVARCSSVPH